MPSSPASRNLPAQAARLFASLTPAHQGRGRVRYRYRLTPGLPALAPHALQRMAQEIPGVTRVRLNTAARAIALPYKPCRLPSVKPPPRPCCACPRWLPPALAARRWRPIAATAKAGA